MGRRDQALAPFSCVAPVAARELEPGDGAVLSQPACLQAEGLGSQLGAAQRQGWELRGVRHLPWAQILKGHPKILGIRERESQYF